MFLIFSHKSLGRPTQRPDRGTNRFLVAEEAYSILLLNVSHQATPSSVFGARALSVHHPQTHRQVGVVRISGKSGYWVCYSKINGKSGGTVAWRDVFQIAQGMSDTSGGGTSIE